MPNGDHVRALSLHGRDQAQLVGAYMRQKNMVPDIILCSDSLRTRSTARLVVEKIFGDTRHQMMVRLEKKLYLASASALAVNIQNTGNDFGSLLLVAHNPGVADLALHLGGAAAIDRLGRYKPATLARFHLGIDDWKDLEPSLARLDDVFIP